MSGDLAPQWRWNVTANADWARNESVTTTGFSATAAQARLNANDPAFNPYAAFAAGVLTPLADNSTETRTSSADAQLLTCRCTLASSCDTSVTRDLIRVISSASWLRCRRRSSSRR